MISAFWLVVVLIVVFSVSARNPLPDQTDDRFQEECLRATNQKRDQHKDTPKLKVSQKIVAYAKERCQTRSMAPDLTLGHSDLKDHGENLFWSAGPSKSLMDCRSAVNEWYNEISDYDFNQPGYSPSAGHFTQLVWRATRQVGCARCGGKTNSRGTETYIVCNYKQPGNVLPEENFRKNVMEVK